MSFENEIQNEYFEWLYSYVCKNRAHRIVSYERLFWYLHQIEFTYSIPRDSNRAADGIDLRRRFVLEAENNYDLSVIDILDGPCSVLEMMVALAIRCEESIMDNTQYGDRTGQWFWGMLHNMEISHMTDDLFDAEYVEERVFIFLDRRYEPDGRGGLFHIEGCQDDLRDVEIWSQLCWYLNSVIF